MAIRFSYRAWIGDFRLGEQRAQGLRIAYAIPEAEFAASVLQPNGAKKKADFGVDSLLAGQVNYRMTESLSLVGQAVANKNADDKFTPHLEWAFAKYAITN